MTVANSPPPQRPDFPLLNSPTRHGHRRRDASMPPVFDVDDAIEAVGLGRFQYVVLLLTGLCWTAESMEMLLLSFIKSPLQCEWGISDEQAALITTCVAIGMLLGATVWGVIADKFGRRFGFIASTTFTAVLGLVSAASVSYPTMLASRGLVGFGIGGVPVSFSILMEVLPNAQRGSWGMSLAFFWALGAIFEAAVAMAVLPTYGWRWLIAVSTLPLFLVLALSFWLSESPRWLIAHGRVPEAKKVLHRIARVNNRSLPEGELVLNSGRPPPSTPGAPADPVSAAVGSPGAADAAAAYAAASEPSTSSVALGPNVPADYIPPEPQLDNVPAPAPVAHDSLESGQSNAMDASVTSDVPKSNFAALVRPGSRLLAGKIWLVWFVSAFVYYGVIMLQPEFIVAENANHRCTYALRECAAHKTQEACKGEEYCTWKPGEATQCIPTGTAHKETGGAAARFFAQRDGATASAETAGVGKSNAKKRDPHCARTLTRSDFLSTLWASVGELPGVLVALVFVNIVGRRPLMGYMCAISAVCFLLLTWCIGRMAETIVFFITRGMTSGVFQTIYLYTNEVYPSVVRARAMGVASSMARCGLIITPFIAQYLSNVSNIAAVMIYMGSAIIAFIAVMSMPIETTGRPLVDSMEQLVDLLRNGDQQHHGRGAFAKDPAVPKLIRLFRWKARLDGMAST